MGTIKLVKSSEKYSAGSKNNYQGFVLNNI